MKNLNKFIVFLIVIATVSCDNKKKENKLFERVNAEFSGINFNNRISTDDSINIVNYEYLYNGGGVGIGHFNEDSLPDIIFTGNMVSSRLYLNQGLLQFKDVTQSSGIDTKGKWCTGVSIIDINNDGLDDIYISVGGMGNKSTFPNLLYISNGDSTFTESAKEYGIADTGESIQAAFFDYDLDGDLDMYLLTGGGFENSAINVRPMRINGVSRNTDRLYRNDFDEEMGHATFTDVSEEAGIKIEGFGLGVSIFDANGDDWPDIYVSNDYLSRDLLYVNQKNGTFQDEALDYFGHVSHFSMGNDVADIDNDGVMDLITVDMLPEDIQRQRLMSGIPSQDIFQISIGFGYGHQHMRNMLQYNNDNSTFSEIGQLSGIEKSDWSWAPLMADFNNDGLNDLFITNGFGKDITDMDFVKFREQNARAYSSFDELKKAVIDCLYQRPPIEVSNYMYRNTGNLSFEKVTEEWGLDEKSISNGTAYTDLDLDGDLDLVVSNINQEAFIYKNRLVDIYPESSNFLKVSLNGGSKNNRGIGSTVSIYKGKQIQNRYSQFARGFQSTVDSKIHFGLGNDTLIDSLIVKWPDGKINVMTNVSTNRLITVNYDESIEKQVTTRIVSNSLLNADSSLQQKHQDKYFNDYSNQNLLLHGFSNQGPGLAVGDLNNDGLEDVFFGGSYGSNSSIHYQQPDGTFNTIEMPETELFEDGAALIFDANGDGASDLYVTSGGSERYDGHTAYQDRLYLNVRGNLKQVELPNLSSSTSTVVGGDYDNDGDIDLFVGGRVVPGKYPLPPQSYILENNDGVFSDVTDSVCQNIRNIGMVTSAIWTDYNNDANLDLVVVGEFMPITIFQGNGAVLTLLENNSVLSNSSGLWNSIQSSDIDNDGNMDFIIGNHGLNSNLKIIENNPLELHYADFDNNGSVDPIFSKFEQGNYYPIASLDHLVVQLPKIKKEFLYYHDYASSTTKDLLDLLGTIEYSTLKAQELRTSVLKNLGNNEFELVSLPNEVQVSPINGILPYDFNSDGYLDLLLVGNNYNTEIAYGRYDASFGHLLLNDRYGNFNAVKNKEIGLKIKGNSKSIVKLDTGNCPLIVIGKNNQESQSIKPQSENNEYLSPTKFESYAIIQFDDGSGRKEEFNLGSGYMSQSSNKIRLISNIKKIIFFDHFNRKTREVSPASDRIQ